MKKTWLGSEFAYIRNNWKSVTDKEFAEHFGVTVNAVIMARYRIGLKRPLNISD